MELYAVLIDDGNSGIDPLALRAAHDALVKFAQDTQEEQKEDEAQEDGFLPKHAHIVLSLSNLNFDVKFEPSDTRLGDC